MSIIQTNMSPPKRQTNVLNSKILFSINILNFVFHFTKTFQMFSIMIFGIHFLSKLVFTI